MSDIHTAKDFTHYSIRCVHYPIAVSLFDFKMHLSD